MQRSYHLVTLHRYSFLKILQRVTNEKYPLLVVIAFFTDKSKGFAFVEFELEEDAQEAIENMDGAELFGKTIRCNIAKQTHKIAAGKAAWTAEDWIHNSLQETPSIQNLALKS